MLNVGYNGLGTIFVKKLCRLYLNIYKYKLNIYKLNIYNHTSYNIFLITYVSYKKNES